MKKLIITKPIYLLWVVCIITLSLLGACQKENKLEKDSLNLKCPVIAKEGPNDSVIGKWKLVKVEIVFAPTTEQSTRDYSCDNIVYEFQEGGILIVTGTSENMRAYKNGQYPFEFKDTKLNEYAPEKYTLEIKNRSISCGIQDNKMIFNDSDLDGDIVHFVRVE